MAIRASVSSVVGGLAPWREQTIEAAAEALGYPLFTKPATLGSSVGVSKVHDTEELAAGLEASQRASSIGAGSERERGYVDAMAAFYADADTTPHGARASAYRAKMEALAARFPDDSEARIFLALLGKRAGFDGAGWRDAAAPYGEEGSKRSVADIVDQESLAEVRKAKQAAKAAAKQS